MGDWGRKSFENDAACDWFYDFKDHGIGAVTAAIWTVTYARPDDISNSMACDAIAAAAVLAAAHDGDVSELPIGAEDALERYGSELDSIALISVAYTALEKIVDNSELCELWRETDVFEDWLSEMEKLKARLRK